jgi:hypothetical protein
VLSDLLHGVFQNKLIECHQSEGWIAWFDARAQAVDIWSAGADNL